MTMRFMVMGKATATTEAGVLPKTEDFAAMGAYNEELVKAGILLYYLLPSVRGDLLAKLGRPAEARAEFERAAGLTANERERDLLLARAQECA
jgi:predicted RNA polymerase sigma factor